jgi:hypothetical protein
LLPIFVALPVFLERLRFEPGHFEVYEEPPSRTLQRLHVYPEAVLPVSAAPERRPAPDPT